MSKQQAAKKVSELTSEAMSLIRQAEAIAEKHELTFSFDIAYGMGGTYYGNPDDVWDDDEPGWQASSTGC